MTGTWLLDLTIGGRVLRYATREVVAIDSTGVGRVYRRGLSDFSLRLDGLETEAGVEVIDRGINWAELAARGDGLERQPAVLRFWVDGQVLGQARVAVDGLVEQPEYGDPEAPSALVLTVRDPSTDALYPPSTAVVDETTWTYEIDVLIFSDLISGAVYPTVFGFPGGGDNASFIPFGATPALLVTFDYTWPSPDVFLVIADGEVDADEVCVWAPEMRSLFGPALLPGSAFFEFRPVETTTDALGRTVSIVKFNPTPNDPITDVPPWDLWPHPDQPYYVGWQLDTGRGGGKLRSDRSGPIRSLTDVLGFVLRNSGHRVDLQAQEAEGNRLDHYLIDGCLNERLALLPWFESNLLPLFPVVRARTSRGLYYRFVHWTATAVDAIMHLSTVDRRVTRASSIRSSGNIANVFALEYQLKLPGSQFRKRAVLSHANSATFGIIDERVVAAPILARSHAKYGEIEAPTVQTEWTWSDSTASRVLAYWATRDGLPRRFVEYAGPELHTLSRGDVVTITDPEIGLDDAVAIVDGVTLSSGRLHRVALEVIDLAFRSTV